MRTNCWSRIGLLWAGACFAAAVLPGTSSLAMAQDAVKKEAGKSDPAKGQANGYRFEVKPDKFEKIKVGENNALSMDLKVYPPDGYAFPQGYPFKYLPRATVEGKKITGSLRIFQDGKPDGKVLEEIPLKADCG